MDSFSRSLDESVALELRVIGSEPTDKARQHVQVRCVRAHLIRVYPISQRLVVPLLEQWTVTPHHAARYTKSPEAPQKDYPASPSDLQTL